MVDFKRMAEYRRKHRTSSGKKVDSMQDLELVPSGFRSPDKCYELRIRDYDGVEVNHVHIAYVGLHTALTLEQITSGISFKWGHPYLSGDPAAQLQTCVFCGETLPRVCKTGTDIEDTIKRFPDNTNLKEPKPNLLRGKCDEGWLKYNAIKTTIEQENKL